ncbi:integrase [Cucumis melo var. makuwa]|uniref:Integrase n=1 Tax=Cucumis melo var. makuwa TaxID=1194695 RepID=A0A5A7TAB7_CUCMM|nr:integrase [Cucumis melo var. makuwa]
MASNGYIDVENQSELTNQQLVELTENRKKEKKTLFFIYQAVDEFIFERISTATSAKAAWDILKSTYQGEDKVKMIRLQALKSEFDCIKMKETETIEEFFNRILVIVNSLGSNREEVANRKVVRKILRRAVHVEDEEVEETMIIEAVQILKIHKKALLYLKEEEEALAETKEVVVQGSKVLFEGDICAIKDQTGVLIAKEQGIHHQMTARMTPQQNGVAERKNRTIMEMARSMLKAKNLQNEFWGDVVECTVYILNRAPKKYSRKIISSRDVIFNEDESWNWSDNVDKAKSPFHVNINENKVAQELEQVEIQAVETSSSSMPSSTSDDEISPRRIRSIQKIYNATNRINDDHFANFALFAGVDPVTFDEAIQDEKWKITMDQEIDAIRRNETWE